MGRLTTHVLDTADGVPARGIAVRLYKLGKARELRTSTETNADGRSDIALLQDEDMQTGTYEIEFDVGSYFGSRGAAVSDPAFLDTVVIRFAIRADENYHIPLLVSPWSYSTYRGS